MGIADEDTTPIARLADARLRNLTASRSILPARPTGPSGHVRAVEPSTPLDVGLLDYMLATQHEVIEHTRASVVGPLPPASADIYRWYEQQTPAMDAGARRAGEAMLYRQGLEHALRAGEVEVIRKERCPSCRCFTLTWKRRLSAAICDNDRDLDEQQRNRRWTLAQLAQQAVENSSMRAAT